MGKQIGESTVEAAKISARGRQYLVAEDDYDKTITAVLNEMREQNLTSGFMAFDTETLSDLQTNKKEFVLWIRAQGAKNSMQQGLP